LRRFCGATLARLVAGDSIWDAARYANAAAALKTIGFGAVDPLPRPSAVRALLSKARLTAVKEYRPRRRR